MKLRDFLGLGHKGIQVGNGKKQGMDGPPGSKGGNRSFRNKYGVLIVTEIILRKF